MPVYRLVLALLAVFALASPARAEDTAACLAAAKPGWSASEAWAWGQICAGKPADFAAGLPGTPFANDISARFMNALLFDANLRGQVPHSGVHIAGAHFVDALALANAAPGFELALERSDFLGNVDFHGLSDPEEVSFAGSRFASLLDLDGAKLGANLERLNVAHNLSIPTPHLPGINLLGAVIAGDLTLRDCVITGWAWLENVQVGSDIFLEKSRLEKVDLPGAVIAGNLLMTGDDLSGPLNMKGTKIGGDLAMDGKATFQAVALPDADVAYSMRLDSSHVVGPLS